MKFTRCFLFLFIVLNQKVYALAYDYHFSLATNMTYIESITQQARSFGVAPAVKLNADISEYLVFKSQALALLETGSHKSTLLDEFKPAQQVVLNFAFFDFTPWSLTHFTLGAVPMKQWAPDILIGSTAFFGASFNQALPLWNDTKLNLQALAAIPSNQELTNRLGGVSEGTPSYWQAGVNIFLPGDILGIRAKGFIWAYDDVNGNVAFQSGFMGNQTLGIGSANTRLAYNFKGYSGSIDFNGAINEFNWVLGADYIFNDGAPNKRNQATKLKISISYLEYISTLSWFEIQSDAVIGYYNNSLLGHTNRNGLSYLFNITLDKKSSLQFEYVHSKIIKSTLVQSDQDAISMGWSYDLN